MSLNVVVDLLSLALPIAYLGVVLLYAVAFLAAMLWWRGSSRDICLSLFSFTSCTSPFERLSLITRR